jgi:hypothetical protein
MDMKYVIKLLAIALSTAFATAVLSAGADTTGSGISEAGAGGTTAGQIEEEGRSPGASEPHPAHGTAGGIVGGGGVTESTTGNATGLASESGRDDPTLNVPSGPATAPGATAGMAAEGQDTSMGGTTGGSAFGGASGVTSTGGSQVGGVPSGTGTAGGGTATDDGADAASTRGPLP